MRSKDFTERDSERFFLGVGQQGLKPEEKCLLSFSQMLELAKDKR